MPRHRPAALLAAALLLPAAPAAAAPPDPPGAVPTVAGTWSGTTSGPGGTVRQAERYTPDGRFTATGRTADGITLHLDGTWSETPAGPGRLRLQVRPEHWLPREICRTSATGLETCQPVSLPPPETILVAFDGPDSLHGTSEAHPGVTVAETRDPDPPLLREPVPERAVLPRAQALPTLDPDDMQQRRICTVIDGGVLSRDARGHLHCNTP